MSSVKVVAITKPLVDGVNSADEFIAYTARVSNPSNQMNVMTAPKLINYCINNKHWSVFEQVFLTLEVNTTRDIGRQILRHRSFTFQEFSQRYSDPTKDLTFVTREARLQDTKNRQNSIEIDNDSYINYEWELQQELVTNAAIKAYNLAIELGIAKEQARAVLPEGLITTRMYMSGSLRSFIHWIDIRKDVATQKEHREVALAAQNEILEHFPSLEEYWFPKTTEEYINDSITKKWWKFWNG